MSIKILKTIALRNRKAIYKDLRINVTDYGAENYPWECYRKVEQQANMKICVKPSLGIT